MLSLLKSVRLFSDLTPNECQTLLDQSSFDSYTKHSSVFLSGSDPAFLYVVSSGKVKLFNIRNNTHKEETVCVIRPAGFFCLSPLINNETLHINAKTIEDTEIMKIRQQALMDLIENSHDFAKKVIRFLAKKECELCEEVCDLSLATTKERLAKYLLKVFEESKESSSFILPLNQADLASKLGTVRETTSRDLAQLKKSGIISMKQKTIKILDYSALSSIAYNSRDEIPSLQVISD